MSFAQQNPPGRNRGPLARSTHAHEGVKDSSGGICLLPGTSPSPTLAGMSIPSSEHSTLHSGVSSAHPDAQKFARNCCSSMASLQYEVVHGASSHEDAESTIGTQCIQKVYRLRESSVLCMRALACALGWWPWT